MEMTFRWFGEGYDSVTLPQIRQIPGVTGIITTLYNIYNPHIAKRAIPSNFVIRPSFLITKYNKPVHKTTIIFSKKLL